MKDFTEAFTFAKCSGQNNLNLIIYDHNLKPHEAAALNRGISAIAQKFSNSQNIVMHCSNTILSDLPKAEEGSKDSLPEWFKQYMEKFKGEILKDLRSSIAQMVHEEFDKKKQLAKKKLIKSLPDKNKSSFPIEMQKRKKSTYKNSLEEWEKREIKLLKKTENLQSYKLQSQIAPFIELAFSKLENKPKAVSEEKKKLLERESQQKARSAKRTPDQKEKRDTEELEKDMKNEKSAIFQETDMFLVLQPGAEFSVTVSILNNGECPLVSPHIQCLNIPAIYLKEHVINLSRLEPGESVTATLRGKVSQRPGNYYFSYQLFDGSEEFIGPLFTSYVVVSDSREEVINNYFKKPQPDSMTSPKSNVMGTYVDVKEDVIAGNQKKIKENIVEIEKMLQDIDLLGCSTTGDETRETELINNAKQFESMGCDLLQGKEKNRKERLQETVNRVDLHQNEGTEKSKQISEDMVESGNFKAKKIETEVDSDSELSVFFMSEEEENFVFLPSLSENSNSEEVNNATNQHDLSKESLGVICNESLTKNAPGDASSQQFKETYFARFNTALDTLSNDSPVISPLTGEIPSLRIDIGDEIYYNQGAFHYVSHNIKETTSFQDAKTNISERKNHWVNTVSTSDCFGNPIYAVRNDRFCHQVEDLIQNKGEILDVDVKEKAQNEVKEETNINHKQNAEGSTVTTVLNVSINSASSLESTVLNTANSTVDYFQSALKPEVEIKPNNVNEPEQPMELPNNYLGGLYSIDTEQHYMEGLEIQKLQKYMNAKLTLHEMGFQNDRLNFHLLQKHDNEVIAVVNEILDMSPMEPPQDVEYFF